MYKFMRIFETILVVNNTVCFLCYVVNSRKKFE